jgi:hypothetical protein
MLQMDPLGAIGFLIEYVIGPLLRLVGLERLVTPKPRLGEPQQQAAEAYLSWWHVPVSLPRRRWQRHRDSELSRARLIVEGTNVSLAMAFSGGPEPEEVVTLHIGEEPRWIPVAIRSLHEGDVSASPLRAYPRFHVAERWVHLTDLLTIRGGRIGEDLYREQQLESDATYPLRIEITSRGEVITHQRYVLTVPKPEEDNRQFVLRLRAGG